MTIHNMTSKVRNTPSLAPLLKTIGVALISLVVAISSASGAEFKVYDSFQEGLEAAKIANKPLIVDYYTDW